MKPRRKLKKPVTNELNDACRQRLRQLRESLDLSRPKFAELLGIPPTTLKNYELAYREIGGTTLLRMANHPELSGYLPWLMTGQGEQPPQPH